MSKYCHSSESPQGSYSAPHLNTEHALASLWFKEQKMIYAKDGIAYMSNSATELQDKTKLQPESHTGT